MLGNVLFTRNWTLEVISWVMRKTSNTQEYTRRLTKAKYAFPYESSNETTLRKQAYSGI